MRITLISLVVDLSKNEAVSLYTAQGTICYSIFKRFYRLDSASSPKYHRVQYFIYRVDGSNFSVSALCDVCREVHTMHNMAVDSVDYTRVYTICEDVSARVYYTHRLSLIYECV